MDKNIIRVISQDINPDSKFSLVIIDTLGGVMQAVSALEEYNVGRGVHSTKVDEAYAKEHGFAGIDVGIPHHHLEATHFLVRDRPCRLSSARYLDRRTGSQLLFGDNQLTFVPGRNFAIDEPLYRHFSDTASRYAVTSPD